MSLLIPTNGNAIRTAMPARVDRLFDRLLGDVFKPLDERAWAPAMDLVDHGEALELYVDLPGIDPQTVEVSIVEDSLTLSGERTAPADLPEDARWYRFERRYGAFSRTIDLPSLVDADAATAHANHGLLTIRLPKQAAVRPRKLRIEG